MSLLILALPPGPASPYAWATSADGQQLSAHGTASAELLPAAGRGVEVVAVLPAAQLSWHRVQLPRGVGPRSPRLRATLVGLLEDQLLDEPEQLHFALGPDTGAGGAAWVAVCRRDGLLAHLRALDAAGRPVARIVPERSPEPGALQLDFIGEPERAQLLVAGGPDGGAQALPWSAGTL
ncbi:type II secretion system protein GspL, partial [Ottowia sp.]|uniref:type II secretion system protein GspL n=1 Tax=Ottowia sp. TaxID=1898956 RepID=UPI0025D06A2B